MAEGNTVLPGLMIRDSTLFPRVSDEPPYAASPTETEHHEQVEVPEAGASFFSSHRVLLFVIGLLCICLILLIWWFIYGRKEQPKEPDPMPPQQSIPPNEIDEMRRLAQRGRREVHFEEPRLAEVESCEASEDGSVVEHVAETAGRAVPARNNAAPKQAEPARADAAPKQAEPAQAESVQANNAPVRAPERLEVNATAVQYDAKAVEFELEESMKSIMDQKNKNNDKAAYKPRLRKRK